MHRGTSVARCPSPRVAECGHPLAPGRPPRRPPVATTRRSAGVGRPPRLALDVDPSARMLAPMIEEFVSSMAAKVGISEEQARAVVEFLKENADKVPSLLSSDALGGLKSKLPGGLGGLFG